ncbi:MAG: M23 family metallopeptidase [Nannocystaceae bacterium]
MRARLAIAIALGLGLAPGCKPPPAVKVPEAKSLRATSAIHPDVDRLLKGIIDGDIASLRAWMTPWLRGQVGASDLIDASGRIRKRHGRFQGIVEERAHREGALTWYSVLVLHRGSAALSQGDGRLRLMLYQFAVDGKQALTRLLVREHIPLRDTQPPANHYLAITRFHFPSAGEWTIVHGGRRKSTNYHHGSRSQRFAYDIVIKDVGRQRGGKENRDALCYGKVLTAPATGTVVVAINNVAENRPGTTGKLGGNGVVIDHGFGEFSSLWHMIPGTVKVKVGDRVELGQELGKVGNSGHSSGPHIHFHASSDPRRSDEFGIPAPFVDVYVDGAWQERALPVRGQRIRRVSQPGEVALGPEIYLDL